MPKIISNEDAAVVTGSVRAGSVIKISVLDELFMNENLNEVMGFVNAVRSEFSTLYNWKTLDRQYFINGLTDKWKYSSIIRDITGNICLVNFSSLYNGDTVHMHGTYVDPKHRSKGLAKSHMMYFCRLAVKNGIGKMEGYWPKNNSGSILLHLLMGWYIDSINDEKNCVKLIADPKTVAERTAGLIEKTTKKNHG